VFYYARRKSVMRSFWTPSWLKGLCGLSTIMTWYPVTSVKPLRWKLRRDSNNSVNSWRYCIYLILTKIYIFIIDFSANLFVLLIFLYYILIPIDFCMRLFDTERIAGNQYHILRDRQRAGIFKENRIRTNDYCRICREGKGE